MSNLEQLFLTACKAGQVEKVAAAITLEVAVNCVDEFGWTGLMWCVKKNHIEAMDLLLQHQQIDINIKNRRNCTALMLACFHNNSVAVERIGNMPGVELNTAHSEYGNTALLYAVYQGHTACVTEILKLPGLDLDIKNKAGDSAFILAVKKGFVDLVNKMLTIGGLDCNVKDTEGDAAVMIALKSENLDILKAIIRVPEADLGTTDKHKKTLEQVAR